MEYQLRQATPEDAMAVVLFHTLAHEESYGHLLSPEFFRGRRASISERVERRRPHLAVTDPRIIAVDGNNRIVGLGAALLRAAVDGQDGSVGVAGREDARNARGAGDFTRTSMPSTLAATRS